MEDIKKQISYEINGETHHIEVQISKKANRSGGNCNVFLDESYAIKILRVTNKVEKYKRMINEINETINIQNKAPNSIVPILYKNVSSFENQQSGKDVVFYVMPKCDVLNDVPPTINDYLNVLLDCAYSLKEIHKCGYAHRDVKKSNVLKYNNKWIMSDYGCIFPYRLDERISEDYCQVGPRGSPEELQKIDMQINNKELEIELFQSSDTFLFAKMMWHIINKGPLFEGSLEYGDDNYWQFFKKFKKLYPNFPVLPLLDIMKSTILYSKAEWENRLTLEEIIEKLQLYKEYIKSFNSIDYKRDIATESILLFEKENLATSSVYVSHDSIKSFFYLLTKTGALSFDNDIHVFEYEDIAIEDNKYLFKNGDNTFEIKPNKIELFRDKDMLLIEAVITADLDGVIFSRSIQNQNFKNVIHNNIVKIKLVGKKEPSVKNNDIVNFDFDPTKL